MRVLYYFIILIIIGLVWIVVEPQLYRVKQVSLKSKKIGKKIKVVFISDLHYGNYYYNFRLKRIVQSINKLEADFIIIGGDYIENNEESKFNKRLLEKVFSELHFLKSKMGVITVLGNHEYYFKKNISFMIEFLEENNITLLRNNTLELVVGNDKVLIHGVEDLIKGFIDIKKLKINMEHLNIVVSHNPDFYEEYELDFDIGLSGHTHGGQINFFGLYAPVTESKYGQKYVRRINRKNNSTIITTKGLGCSMFPIRFFAMPEIVKLEINPIFTRKGVRYLGKNRS